MSAAKPAEKVFKDPLAPTLEEIEASIERSLADVKAGRTIDGHVFLRELRARIDAAKARQLPAHGSAKR